MFLDIIQKIKSIKPDVHITIGGHFPTFEYIKLLENKYIDSLIRFEGEKPITLLMDCIMNGKDLSPIPNLLHKDKDGKVIENIINPEFPNLDNLPFPIRNKKPQYRLGEKFATLITSRGCFYSKCLYCCIGAFHTPKKGPKYAIRTPENIAHEMAHLYHNDGVKLFQFHDDNFLLPKQKKSLERVKSIKKALIKEKVDIERIAVMIKTRPECLDEDLMSYLVEMGTVGIFLGVENASTSGLKALARGSNLDEVYDSIEIIDNHPVAMTFNLLIFHPRANLEEINQNIFFMNKNLDKSFDFGRAEIVAGSPLEKLVKRKGLIRGHWPQWDYIIEDNAVEKMFRINALTFYHKNSPYPHISHQLIALSYRLQLLERLYPGEIQGHHTKIQ
jgi:anaerobic magnesium-protoporphyrin IX monomethyl ester cyclase